MSLSKSKKRKVDEDKGNPRLYNESWEKEKWAQGWLKKNTNNILKQAYCKICHKELRAHQTDLKKHAETDGHVRGMECVNVNKQRTLPNMSNVHGQSEEKERDIKLALFTACHGTIRSIDHLCDLLNDLKFKNLHLHRTKCTSIIQSVIAPNLLFELVEDVGSTKYSLIVDESTDCSTKKYICLCIKYFSIKLNRHITDFLGLLEIEKADANSLFEVVNNFLKEINLPISNLIGLGTDGGSNLCGKNNSLFTLLRAQAPDLQLVRCVCHSLNLAASHAADEFPAAVDYLCREIFNWFSNSPLRKSTYRTLWNTLNKTEESLSNEQKIFHQFVKLSGTRWLARYNVVSVLLEHYLELKTHFSLVITKEKDYLARQLNQMLNDDANYLYLKIVRSILFEINIVNLSFQKNQANIGSAYDDLKNLIVFLSNKILKKEKMTNDFNELLKRLEDDANFVKIEDADYGIEYKTCVRNLYMPEEAKTELESRAYNYIKKLCSQLCQRLPTNLEFFQKLQMITPVICLNQVNRPKFEDLPFLKIFARGNDLGIMENQYNKLIIVNWADQLDMEDINDAYRFWAHVHSFKNAGGVQIFKELAIFILTLISLPTSNAVVERMFSIMNSTKNKMRNRMQLQLLCSILRIKAHFFAINTCCNKFKPSVNMIKDFNSKIMYPQKSNSSLDQISLEEETEVLNFSKEFELPCISIPDFE